MTRVNRSQSLLKWEILSERANSQPWEKTSRNTGKKGRNCYFNNIYRWGGNSTPLMNSYLPKFKFFRYFFTNSAKTFFLTTAWAQKIQVSWGHQKVHAALNNFFFSSYSLLRTRVLKPYFVTWLKYCTFSFKGGAFVLITSSIISSSFGK